MIETLCKLKKIGNLLKLNKAIYEISIVTHHIDGRVYFSLL